MSYQKISGMRSNRFPLMGLGCACNSHPSAPSAGTAGLGCGCSAPPVMPIAGLGLDLASLGVGAGVVIAGVAGLGVGWMACRVFSPKRPMYRNRSRRRRSN